MPELPEVETIVKALKQGGRGGSALPGKVIKNASLLWEKTLMQTEVGAFSEALPGQKIIDISRRAKYIVMQLTQFYLLVHLKMSGDLRVEKADEAHPLQKHDRFVIVFTDGEQFVFNDTRKFGKVWLVKEPKTVLNQLGPEPLSDEFTPVVFGEMLSQSHRQLKPLLLDQKFLAGLGNIYTDEALHLSGLHPLRIADKLSEEEILRLWKAIREVLQDGINRNGASIDWVYRGGTFQNQFRVYGRTGEACLNCGDPIERTVVGQRGTHFCPRCQPEE
jgi:formamidopyrimidine-DNA glycosylase